MPEWAAVSVCVGGHTYESVSLCVNVSDRGLCLCWRGYVLLCVYCSLRELCLCVALHVGMALHDTVLEHP